MPRNKERRQYRAVIISALCLFIAVLYSSLTYGVFNITAHDVINTLLRINPVKEHDLLLFQFRLPRIVIAGLVGAGLGLTGAVLQGLSRNGLADPGIIGINAGAGLGIVLFMFFFQGSFAGISWLAVLAMPFFGLAGGLGAMLLVWFFSWENGRLNSERFLLTGIAINAGLGAITLYLTLKMNPADFQMVAVWNNGSIWNANWTFITATVPWFVLLLPVLFYKAPMLDLFQLEPSSLRGLGVAVEKEQVILLLVSTGLVGTCVAVAGNISFVGLIIPHIARRLVGIRHHHMMPVCAILGMLLVVTADFIAKNMFAPVEISVGIVISLIGVPYFIYLLYKAKA